MVADRTRARRRPRGAFAGGLIGSVGAGLSLVAFDLGGWDYGKGYEAGATLDRTGSVGLFEGAMFFVLLVPLVVAAGYIAFASYRQIVGSELSRTHTRNALLVAVAGLVVMLAYRFGFESLLEAEQAEKWWLERGFNGALFGFSAAAASLFMARRAIAAGVEREQERPAAES